MASPSEFTDEQGRRYAATEELGRGVLTAVYKAVAMDAGGAGGPGTQGSTSIALKTVLPLWIGHPLAEARIAREREVSASLYAPGQHNEAELLCGRVIAGGRQHCDGRTRPFHVSVLLEGQTLAERLRGGADRDSLHRSLAWADDLLSALARVHAAGWVHRDVKPQNVFVCGRGNAWLIDFGLAVPIGAPRADGDEAFGTPAYVCPEVIAGAPVDPRADLYSVGLILFELLAGQRPFASRDPVAMLEAHLSETPPRLRQHRPACSETLDRVVAATLAKHPEERPASAEALRALLRDTPEGSSLAAAALREDCAPRVEA